MANRSLFQSLRGALLPQTDATNGAAAPAYDLGPQAALAQLAATGCLTNTFARHGVYQDAALVRRIAARLSNPELIAKARVFPYQLMVAYHNCDSKVPVEIREALQDAMETSISNVPDLTPNTTTQALSRPDILNVGGFSDSLFDLIAGFAAGADGTAHWPREIQLQPLNPKMKIA